MTLRVKGRGASGAAFPRGAWGTIRIRLFYSLLIFIHASPDTTKRDLGAGRSEETDEGGPNREQMVLVTFPERKVTRRKGEPISAPPQITDVHTIPVHPTHRIAPVVTSECSYRGLSDPYINRRTSDNGCTHNPSTPDPPHRSLPLVVSSYRGRVIKRHPLSPYSPQPQYACKLAPIAVWSNLCAKS